MVREDERSLAMTGQANRCARAGAPVRPDCLVGPPMKSDRRGRARQTCLAAAVGAAIPFFFAAVVQIWGSETLAWPAFRAMLVFVYPFARVPVTASLYPLFLFTTALNACYYGLTALVAVFVRQRGASALVAVVVVLLIVVVSGPVLHLMFENLGAIRIR